MIRKTLLSVAALAALTLGRFYGWGRSLPATNRAARDVRLVTASKVVLGRVF